MRLSTGLAILVLILGGCRTTPVRKWADAAYRARGSVKLSWKDQQGHFWFKTVVDQEWHWVGLGVPGSGVRVALVWTPEELWVLDAKAACRVRAQQIHLLGRVLGPNDVHDAFLFHSREAKDTALSKAGFKTHIASSRWTYENPDDGQQLSIRVRRKQGLASSELAQMKMRFTQSSERYRAIEVGHINLDHPDQLQLCP